MSAPTPVLPFPNPSNAQETCADIKACEENPNIPECALGKKPGFVTPALCSPTPTPIPAPAPPSAPPAPSVPSPPLTTAAFSNTPAPDPGSQSSSQKSPSDSSPPTGSNSAPNPAATISQSGGSRNASDSSPLGTIVGVTQVNSPAQPTSGTDNTPSQNNNTVGGGANAPSLVESSGSNPTQLASGGDTTAQQSNLESTHTSHTAEIVAPTVIIAVILLLVAFFLYRRVQIRRRRRNSFASFQRDFMAAKRNPFQRSEGGQGRNVDATEKWDPEENRRPASIRSVGGGRISPGAGGHWRDSSLGTAVAM